MKRIKSLNGYQKGVLIFTLAIALIFSVIYPCTLLRNGYPYRGKILVPAQVNGNTVYSGRIDGEEVRFVVSDHNTLHFQCGDSSYGPFTVEEDPSAIKDDDELADYRKGVVVREGDEILFRGGVMEFEDGFWFYLEDGTSVVKTTHSADDGEIQDENGDPVEKWKPTIDTIYDLLNGPELVHRGEGKYWFYGIIICLINVVGLLFADEIYYINISFMVRNAEIAEPSGWEIGFRYFAWTALAICALAIFVTGLL